MKYQNGKPVKLGDIVCWKYSKPLDKGVVVCLIDEEVFINDYQSFIYLKNKGGGIMIKFEYSGLVQICKDDDLGLNDIELLERSNKN